MSKKKAAMVKARIVVSIILVSLFILVPHGGKSLASAGTLVISIKENAAVLCGNAYDPSEVTIPVGTTVVWVNQDIVTHTLVSADVQDPCLPSALPLTERVIDAGQIMQGRSFRMKFNVPGTYFFMCHLPLHNMSGKIIVEPQR